MNSGASTDVCSAMSDSASATTRDYRRELERDVRSWITALAAKPRKKTAAQADDSEIEEGLLRIAWVTDVVFGGNHHVDAPIRLGRGPDRCHAVFRLHGTIASFDFNEMTRLTVAAHEAAIRAEVACRGIRQLDLILHARDRTGTMASRHPTLDDAIAWLKTYRWTPCPIAVPEGAGE